MLKKNTGGDVTDFPQFLKWAKSKTEEVAPKENDWLESFKVFDTHGTGKIAPTDLRSILTSMGEQFTGAEVDEILKDAPTDGEGKIIYAEWAKKLSS